MSKSRTSQRVQSVQQLRRSGAYGSHRGPQDRPRSEQNRQALGEWNEDHMPCRDEDGVMNSNVCVAEGCFGYSCVLRP